MSDEGKPPEPGETLDAPVYEPPRNIPFGKSLRNRLILLGAIGAVASVLAIISLWAVRSAADRSRLPDSGVLQTRRLIDNLSVALVNFERNCFRHPWAEPEEVPASTEITAKAVCAELLGLPGAKINRHGTCYFDASKRSLKDGVLVDAWGSAILFRVDPKTGQPVIWSCGKNGIDETNDGESSDPARFPKGYYWFGKGDHGDDIVRQ